MEALIPGTPASLPPPFIATDGIPNLRDLGGWPIVSSGRAPGQSSIRRGKIYRSGEPTRASGADVEKVREQLHVRRVFDFRSNPEIRKAEQRLLGAGAGGDGVAAKGIVTAWPGGVPERRFCPVFPDEAWDPASMAKSHADMHAEDNKGMVRSYVDILEKATGAYREVVDYIIDNPDDAVLIHCSAGKDRTGVFAALLLSCCGVEDALVAREYALTEQGLASLVGVVVGEIMRSTGSTREQAERVLSAKEEYMLDMLGILRSDFGGPEGYLTDRCGLSDDRLQTLKKLLIVDEAPIVGV